MAKPACPFMSTKAFTSSDSKGHETVHGLIPCVKHQCLLWIQVYTTESISAEGCAYELQPKMVDGQLRV